MSDSVKRVGLVFNEDGSTDFIKSLQKVNSALKENYQDYKLVQSQYDKNTKTTQKLNDTLVYMNGAYDIQKDKVNALKKELDVLTSAENKDETAISKKKIQLKQAEVQLNKYKNQIAETTNKLKLNTEELRQLGSRIESVGSKINKAGNALSVFSTGVAGGLVVSTKNAIEFDDAFTGVKKTVDGTTEELAKIKQEIRNMSKEMPASAVEISKVAESAGQLGIATEDITKFTKVIMDLSNTTNLGLEDGAQKLAKFANITNLSSDNYANLGSVIVDLGNNFATTENDIVEMATRLASTGSLVGLSVPQILALAASMSSVGIEAEAGGSAMSKFLKQIQVACETSSEELEAFAKVSGMTGKEFKELFAKDAPKALQKFLSGLQDTKRNGKSAIQILEDMGIKEVRLSNTILSLSKASGLLNNSLEKSNTAWNENKALTEEANKKYGNLQSQITISKNKLTDMSITLGEKLMPKVNDSLIVFGQLVNKFESLNDEQVDTVLKLGATAIAVGPVTKAVGGLVHGVGTGIRAFATFKEAMSVAFNGATSTVTSVNALAKVLSMLGNPIGIAALGITAGFTAIAIASKNATKDIKADFETMGSASNSFITGISSAKSHLSSFNSTLFVSAAEQQNLANNMQEVQNGITTICKTASNERRDLTVEEINKLDEYFNKLHELKNKELEIQGAIGDAIVQQAETNATNFTGSLEEYKIQSQEYLNTIQQHAETEKAIIQQRGIEEIALLNQKYGDKATLENQEYANEYNRIIESQNKSLEAVNGKIGKVAEAYSIGYTKRLDQENGFLTKISGANKLQEDENKRHEDEIQRIKNDSTISTDLKNRKIVIENGNHKNNLKKIWNDMAKNLSASEADQLGTWLALQTQTELYGGKIDSKTGEIVDGIINSYDTMPAGTKEAMKNAMSPMITEMQKKEPSLFAKATGIANGILTRLKKSFDIHSPSKKTRKIFNQVMEGAEIGLDEKKKDLFNSVAEIPEEINENLSNTNLDLNINSNKARKSALNSNMVVLEGLENIIISALSKVQLKFDNEGFIKIVDKRLEEIL